jgi:hypothetical protein
MITRKAGRDLNNFARRPSLTARLDLRSNAPKCLYLRKREKQIMSAINGDKARFNRERKKKIARRARNQARFKISASPLSKPARRAAQQKEVSL